MKDRYCHGTHVSEAKFREVVRMFSLDIPALTAAKIVGVNRNTTQSFYSRLRERVDGVCRENFEPMFFPDGFVFRPELFADAPAS